MVSHQEGCQEGWTCIHTLLLSGCLQQVIHMQHAFGLQQVNPDAHVCHSCYIHCLHADKVCYHLRMLSERCTLFISAFTIQHSLDASLISEFTQAPQTKCAACWGHTLDLCCCCEAGITQRPSGFSSDTQLGTCPKKVCRAAVQKKGR